MSVETELIDKDPLNTIVKIEEDSAALIEGLIGVDTIMADSIIIVNIKEDK